VDFNDDDVLDLVLGERYGQYFFYTGNGDGTLHFTGHPWDDMGNPIQRNYNSAGYLEDWNNDGKLDFLAGGYDTETTTGGIFHVHLNTSDQPDSPVWDADYIDLTPFYNLWRTTHQFVDLDGDGLKDLILGYEMGEVFFAPNTGTAANPQFSAYSVLQTDGGPMNVYTNYPGGGRAREHVFDYDSDGVLDLIVGCSNGWVYLFTGYYTGVAEGTLLPLGGFGIELDGTPTTGPFSVRITAPENDPVGVTVWDASGRQVASRTAVCTGGTGSLCMDLGGSPAGVYFVTAMLEGEVRTAKLVLIE
jgi:hypothetical protein